MVLLVIPIVPLCCLNSPFWLDFLLELIDQILTKYWPKSCFAVNFWLCIQKHASPITCHGRGFRLAFQLSHNILNVKHLPAHKCYQILYTKGVTSESKLFNWTILYLFCRDLCRQYKVKYKEKLTQKNPSKNLLKALEVFPYLGSRPRVTFF